MKHTFRPYQVGILFFLCIYFIFAYASSCTHKDAVLPASYSGTGTNDPTYYVTRGTDVISFDPTGSTGTFTFDKVHSNVMWEARYAGSGALLTGRFNWFGFRSFHFEEANPAKTEFVAWVQLNKVNTGEPGRDGGCLLTAFNTTAAADTPAVAEPANAFNEALIVSKSVTYNPTENIYDVVCDLTFMGLTKEVKAKLGYAGKGTYTNGVNLLRGFDLRFSISLSAFPLKADQNQVGDAISITADANFKQ